MLNKLTEYEKNTLFKDFRETIVSESKENFSTIDDFLSKYNVDNMLQKRIDQTNSCSYLFCYYDGDNLDFVTGLDTSKVTDMSYMFRECGNLKSVPQLDTSNVTNMHSMFSDCNNLTSIPELDTSKVTDMYGMFSDCYLITTIPQLDTSKVTDMGFTFYNCFALTTMPQLDTSNVIMMNYMFYGCHSLTTIPKLDVSKVTNTANAFMYCSRLTKISMLNIGFDLNIHWSTKMEREALLEVLGNLKDLTGLTSKKLTLGSTLLAKLTDDDKAIATNKNWTLA